VVALWIILLITGDDDDDDDVDVLTREGKRGGERVVIERE